MTTTTRTLAPVPDAVTTRILDLLEQASDLLAQAAYEGSHTLRQDPAPKYGTPWDRPDLPPYVYGDLRAIERDLDRLRHFARHFPR